MRLILALVMTISLVQVSAEAQDLPPTPPGPVDTPWSAAAMSPSSGQSFSMLTGQSLPVGGSAAGSGGGGGSQQDNGTNPAQNLTTFILSNEYYTFEGGNRINTTYARFKFPTFERRGSVLFEVPFVYYDFRANLPNTVPIGGLGDIRIQGTYNFWTSPDKRLTAILFGQAFLPTADNAILAKPLPEDSLTVFNLGTGKYVLGGGVGFVYAFAPNFLIATCTSRRSSATRTGRTSAAASGGCLPCMLGKTGCTSCPSSKSSPITSPGTTIFI